MGPFSATSGHPGPVSGRATRGVDIDAGAEVGFFQSGVNVLYVPDTQILGGTLGLSTTVGIGHIDLDATLSAGGSGLEADTAGWGALDTWIKAQLGWSEGTFFHTAYVSAVLPTGTYETGFSPSTGLNRPAIDAGWGFTWIEPNSKIQLNGTLGFTYNFENTATDYQSGSEMHFEWAIAKDLGEGLTLGVVGYDYRQLTGDSGSGAKLGDFKGSVDAVGLGLGYDTQIGDVHTSISLRHYQEFNVTNRFDGSTTLATVTFAF